MTRTNLIKAARQDAQGAADLRAAMEALLAGSPPQTFTPPSPEPEPEHLAEVEAMHIEDTREISTGDLIGLHFVRLIP